MSDVANCPSCGATCRVAGHDQEGLPKLQAFQDTDAQQKIAQLKKSLNQLQKTLRTERATANARISELEAELSTLRKSVGVS
ncbi:hypothetical protein LEP3755_35320 [Leptolyngbya sp. NIES-3755]|nr:hypothetical protein LEP3755_35320 [Leptolyngbya sp. NIES-3755]